MKREDLEQWERNIETLRKDLIKIGDLCGWESDQVNSMAIEITYSNSRLADEKRKRLGYSD